MCSKNWIPTVCCILGKHFAISVAVTCKQNSVFQIKRAGSLYSGNRALFPQTVVNKIIQKSLLIKNTIGERHVIN